MGDLSYINVNDLQLGKKEDSCTGHLDISVDKEGSLTLDEDLKSGGRCEYKIECNDGYIILFSGIVIKRRHWFFSKNYKYTIKIFGETVKLKPGKDNNEATSE